MTQSRRIALSPTTLAIATTLLLISLALWWGLQVQRKAERVNALWQEELARSEKIQGDLAALLGEMGYGGMIHQFKNYVLRRDQATYQEVRAAFERLEASLSRLEMNFDSTREFQALLPLRRTLDEYNRNLEVARLAIENGDSPEAIDAAVRVDDLRALAGIEVLKQLSVAERAAAVAAADSAFADLRQALFAGLVLLLPVPLAGIYLARATRRESVSSREAEQSAEDLRKILDGSLGGVLSVAISGRITYANSAASRITGYTRRQLTQMSIDELVPESLRAHHGELRAAFMDDLQVREMAARQAVHLRRLDGSIVAIRIGLTPVRVHEATVIVASLQEEATRSTGRVLKFEQS